MHLLEQVVWAPFEDQVVAFASNTQVHVGAEPVWEAEELDGAGRWGELDDGELIAILITEGIAIAVSGICHLDEESRHEVAELEPGEGEVGLQNPIAGGGKFAFEPGMGEGVEVYRSAQRIALMTRNAEEQVSRLVFQRIPWAGAEVVDDLEVRGFPKGIQEGTTEVAESVAAIDGGFPGEIRTSSGGVRAGDGELIESRIGEPCAGESIGGVEARCRGGGPAEAQGTAVRVVAGRGVQTQAFGQADVE